MGSRRRSRNRLRTRRMWPRCQDFSPLGGEIPSEPRPCLDPRLDSPAAPFVRGARRRKVWCGDGLHGQKTTRQGRRREGCYYTHAKGATAVRVSNDAERQRNDHGKDTPSMGHENNCKSPHDANLGWDEPPGYVVVSPNATRKARRGGGGGGVMSF